MAMAIEDIIGYTPLMGVINEVKTGVPDVLPKAFWTTKSKTVGTHGRYTRVEGTREVARLAQYGSPAQRRALQGLKIKDVTLMHFFEDIQLDPLWLQVLRGMDTYRPQEMGQQEVDRQVAVFRKRFDNMRRLAVYSMLGNGAIYFDSNGNLLPTSSGANETVDFNIPANNKNQLNGIVTTSWANANTNIPLQIRSLKERSLQETGYELTTAYYGKNIVEYMTINNYVADYLSREPDKRQAFLNTGELPGGLFGLKWVPVYTAFYKDANGTNQSVFGADSVSFTPEINDEVYELIEGSMVIPTSIDISRTATGALNNIEQVYGMFVYSVISHNPVTVQVFSGDTFLPVWKVPSALYIADVTP